MIFFPAREWNKMASRVTTWALARAGSHCRVSVTSAGTTLAADHKAFQWRHPWSVTPFWKEESKRWEATVRAGFLDGEEPVISGRKKDVSIFDDALPLALSMAEVSPPAYFKALGVRDQSEGARIGDSGVIFVDESWRDDFRPPPRLLARADIVLSKARAALVGDMEQAESSTGGYDVIYTAKYKTDLLDSVGDRGRISSVTEFVPPVPPTLADRLKGNYDEPQEDSLVLATVWMLSPSGDTSSELGPEWEPFTQHRVFWNLAHVAPMPKIPQVAKPITLATGLLGGLADQIFNRMLAPGNDEYQRIQSALLSVSPAGKFHNV